MRNDSPPKGGIAGRCFKMYKVLWASTGVIITFIFNLSSCWTYY